MSTPLRTAAAAACLSLAVAAGITHAHAYTWPGTTPSLGGVIAAKAIGEICPGILAPRDIAALDGFMTRYSREIRRHRPSEHDVLSTFIPAFTKSMRERRLEPGACGASDQEQARDMLKRVRAVHHDGRFWSEVRNPRPGAGAALSAKVVAEACPGTLPAGAAARLQQFAETDMATFARSASAADTEATWAQLRAAEQRLAAAMTGPQHCTPAVTAKARKTYLAIEKSAAK
jgi:hypothetical protein